MSGVLLGDFVSDPHYLFESLVFMDAACLDTGFADGDTGTYQWMLRLAVDHGYQIAVCSLFLLAGLRRDLCVAADRIRNAGDVSSELLERKDNADSLQSAA